MSNEMTFDMDIWHGELTSPYLGQVRKVKIQCHRRKNVPLSAESERVKLEKKPSPSTWRKAVLNIRE